MFVTFVPQKTPVERFLTFVSVDNTEGETIASKVIEKCQNLELDLSLCKGQSYDNGRNITGFRKSVHIDISQLAPSSLVVSCSAHMLNLVLEDVSKECKDVEGFFAYTKRLYAFFKPPSR